MEFFFSMRMVRASSGTILFFSEMLSLGEEATIFMGVKRECTLHTSSSFSRTCKDPGSSEPSTA